MTVKPPNELERVESQLKAREQDLTDLMESAAIGVHWITADGTILWANETSLKLLGYSREEYVGRNVKEFHIDETAVGDILRRLANGENLSEYEARLRSKDGSICYVAISARAVREDGPFVHTRCFLRDITERKHAFELKTRLAAIVESSDDAIISKDLNGIIKSWNRGAERIFGYTADEAIGKHISMLAPPERVDEIPNILDRIRRGERVDHYQSKRRAKDGRVLTVSLTISPIKDSSGAIIGASKVARDFTEREKNEEALRVTNEALRRANADLEQFSYAAAHDLQEPLRMITIYSQMLKKRYAGKLDEQADEYIRYSVEGAARMEMLVRGLLMYTRVTAVVDEPTETVDLNNVLAQTTAILHIMISETGASIRYEKLPEVYAHEIHMQQIFQNLISDAIKYRSDKPPMITVAAAPRGREWLLSVSDNGIGIHEDYKEQIFGLFRRLHTSNEYSGTGIGLAICQRIVERYGGRIWVESVVGEGSTFYFTLPRRSD